MRHEVGTLGPETLLRLWSRLTPRIIEYGFAIEYRTLERPKLGIFDGLKLSIDPTVGFEMQCFLLLHLFGHSVQWVADSYRPETLNVSETDLDVYLAALEQYERNAARFGLQLLREAGIFDLDDWYFAFVETDWRYVERFYRTGQLSDWRDCVATTGPAFDPEPIPPLAPQLVEERFAF